MAYKALLENEVNVYSLFLYKAYDDYAFFKKIDKLFDDNPKYSGETFEMLIDDIVSLYKDEIVFDLKIMQHEYICPVISNEKFSRLNLKLAERLSDALGLKLLCNLFDDKMLCNIDVRDAYTRNNNIELNVDMSYKDKSILFIDVFCSTGVILNEVTKFFCVDRVSIFTIGLRYDCDKLNNTKILSYKEIEFELDKELSDGYVVEITGLFGEKNVVVDFRKNLSIVIGTNGSGKSTAYKIACLAIDDETPLMFELAKYYFEEIKVSYIKYYNSHNSESRYEKNTRIIRTLKYKDVIPSKKRLARYISLESSNKETLNKIRTKMELLFDLYYMPNDSNYLKDISNRRVFSMFMSKVDDLEYEKLFRKIILDDISYFFYISQLNRKYGINANPNVIVNYLKTLLRHKFSLSNHFSILTNHEYIDQFEWVEIYDSHIYYDCTHSRYFERNLDNKQIIFDDSKMYFDEIDFSYSEYDAFDDVNNDGYPEYSEEEYSNEYFESHEDDLRGVDFYTDDYEYDGYNATDYDMDDYAEYMSDYYNSVEEDEEYAELVINRKIDLERRIAEWEEKQRRILKYPYLHYIYSKKFMFKNVGFDYVDEDKVIRNSYTANVFNGDSIDLEKVIRILNSSYINEKLTNFINMINEELKYKSLFLYNENEKVNFDIENDFYNFLKTNQIQINALLNKLDDDVSKKIFELLTNKNLTNRHLFISKFKDVIESLEQDNNDIVIKLIKILNKYFNNKKVKVYLNKLYVLDLKNRIIPIQCLSSGEKNLILILLLCASHRDSFVILDEPDISMNITWQMDLIKDIFRVFSKNNRLIILTQSPQLISRNTYKKFITYLKSTLESEDNFKVKTLSLDTNDNSEDNNFNDDSDLF